MAAETNADAHVPVMIALSRLNVYFFLESLKDVRKQILSFFKNLIIQKTPSVSLIHCAAVSPFMSVFSCCLVLYLIHF